MDRRARLTKQVEEAEREFDAKRLSEVRAAARKLNRAREELRWSEDEQAKRGSSRGRRSASAKLV
jgi:hypothetical protein